MLKHQQESWEFASMGELLAMAKAMEMEAVDGYLALSRRMKDMGRPDLAAVFDSLVAEERGHLDRVDDWRSSLGEGDRPAVQPPEELFDNEGAGVVAPELLSAYRAFSMAVRNEERAFVFWTYVSAHAVSDEIKQASERMAREELGHVAKLRRERRRAFHAERAHSLMANADLPAIERRLARHLNERARDDGPESGRLRALSEEAQSRAADIAARPFATALRLERLSAEVEEHALPLCELLVDSYLDLADRGVDEAENARALAYAAQIIPALRLVRSLGPLRR